MALQEIDKQTNKQIIRWRGVIVVLVNAGSVGYSQVCMLRFFQLWLVFYCTAYVICVCVFFLNECLLLLRREEVKMWQHVFEVWRALWGIPFSFLNNKHSLFQISSQPFKLCRSAALLLPNSWPFGLCPPWPLCPLRGPPLLAGRRQIARLLLLITSADANELRREGTTGRKVTGNNWEWFVWNIIFFRSTTLGMVEITQHFNCLKMHHDFIAKTAKIHQFRLSSFISAWPLKSRGHVTQKEKAIPLTPSLYTHNSTPTPLSFSLCLLSPILSVRPPPF